MFKLSQPARLDQVNAGDHDGIGAAQAGIKTMETIILPEVPEIIAPIIYALPIQMLAYFTAVFMGTDVDQPRNLAKSVTVE